MLRRALLLAAILMTVNAADLSAQPTPATPAKPRWAIAIHGGAGVIERKKLTKVKDKAIRLALKGALNEGSKILEAGGTSLDAVQAAVKYLEDDPNFNAGKGAVLTYDGTISLDAAIMDGKSRRAGAIAGTTIAKNPILAARKVMEESPHVLLSGPGADEFVREQGLETETQDYFETPERRKQLEELKAKNLSWFDVDLKYGTVGAVALDQDGHVAAATSTGGLTGKRWGRVGDSPLIGAGTYADDRACAVSATGAGETFIKVGVAHEICARVRMKGEKIVRAASTVMAEVKQMGGDGGVIVIAPDGQIGWSFNTPGMYRGGRDSSGKEVVAIYGDE
jgi:beta-aspartyl-peptidase (threonine type)